MCLSTYLYVRVHRKVWVVHQPMNDCNIISLCLTKIWDSEMLIIIIWDLNPWLLVWHIEFCGPV